MELLAQFKTFLFSQDNKPSKVTVKNYLSDINHFVRWYESHFNQIFDPKSISQQTIDQYKIPNTCLPMPGTGGQAKYQILSPRSMERHLSSLRKFFTFLKLEGKISYSPFEQIKSEAAFDADPWHIKDFKNYLYVYNASHLTIKNYVIDVKQFLAWAEEVTELSSAIDTKDSNVLNHINSNLIEEYKQRLQSLGSFSPATINRKLSSLRKYTSWLEAESLISQNQELGIKNLELTRPLEFRSAKLDIESLNSRNQDIKDSSSKISHLQPQEFGKPEYSGFPPLRLFQKVSKAFILAFDGFLIIPLANMTDKALMLAWNIKGQPIFTEARKLKPEARNLTSNFQLLNLTSSFHHPISKVKNLPKELYAPLEISTKHFPWYKKVWFTLRYKRPKWYTTYHSYAITHYFHFAVLIIFMAGLGFGFYQGFFANQGKSPALAVLPTAPPRVLSFQGRLTDNNDNPITANTNLRFAIYNNLTASGAALLWQEVDGVAPDVDGIFNVILGNNSAIPSTLFSENAALWLGVTVESTPELTPRQQLATVAYATNAETLQGLLPITAVGATQQNVVLALDSSGNLTIGGSASPVFQATGGTFKLSGQPLLLTTNVGSNGNVQISPDGTGRIDLTKPLVNTSISNNISSAQGAVEVDDLFAILASSSGQSALTINQTGAGPLISASASGVAKFTVGNDGSGYFAGNVGIGTTNPGTKLDVNGNATIQGGVITAGASGGTDAVLTTPYFSGGGTNVLGLWIRSDGAIDNSVSIGGGHSAFYAAQYITFYTAPTSNTVTGTMRMLIDRTGNVGIGTVLPTALLDVAGAASVGGVLKFRSGTAQIQSTADQTLTLGGDTTGNITLSPFNSAVGASVTPGITNQVDLGTSTLQWRNIYGQNIYSNGTLLTNGGFWQRNLGALSPTNITDSINLGSTATSSALVHLAGTAGENSWINTGNVGIGTTAPATKLEIVGGLKLSGTATGLTNKVIYVNSAVAGINPSGIYYDSAITANAVGSATANGITVIPSFTNASGGTYTRFSGIEIASTTITATNPVTNGYGLYVDPPTGATNNYAAYFGGNVGIGTTSPTAKLQVTSANTGAGLLRLNNSGDAVGDVNGIDFTHNAETGQVQAYIRDEILSGWLTKLHFGTANGPGGATTKMTIDQTGNVGIGTTTPTALLDVAGTASVGGVLKFRSGTAQIQSTVNQALTIGGDSTGNITLSPGNSAAGFNVVPGITNQVDLGTSTLQWRNVYGQSFFQNGVLVNLTNYWQRNLGALFPSNITDDLLIGSTASTSADFSITGIATGNRVTASLSGQLIVMPNNGWGGNVGIGTTNPGEKLEVNGKVLITNDGTAGVPSLRINNNDTGFYQPSNDIIGISTAGQSRAQFSTSGLLIETSGSAAVPAIRINNDDNGIFQPAGDTLGFSTSGTERLRIDSLGKIGINATSPLATLDIRPNTTNGGTIAVASVSGKTSFAALVANNDGLGDLFTASSSGVNKFTVKRTGELLAPAYSTCTLKTDATGLFTCGTDNSGGGSPFSELSGAIVPNNSTLDFLIGGQSTAAAKFAITNVNGTRGTQIASVSGSLTLDSATASIQNTNNQLLTLGGNTTGDIQFKPGNSSTSLYLSSTGNVGIGTTNPTSKLTVSGGDISFGEYNRYAGYVGVTDIQYGSDMTFRTNLSGGALARMTLGSTGNLGIGTTTPTSLLHINGGYSNNAALIVNNLNSGDLFTASASGVSKFTVGNSGAITDAAYTNAGGVLYTSTTGLIGQTSVGTASQCLLGGVTPTFGSCGTGTSDPFWSQSNGALYPNNSTVDLLIGGQSTASADFAVLNVNGTGPATATVSGNLIVMPKNGAGGQVGIGTTGPVNKLDVNGGVAIGTYAGVNTAPANGLIVSGNVAIGVATSPTYRLNVENGFSHFSYNTATGPSADGGGGLVLGWNKSGGQAETNFYNVFANAGTAFEFLQNKGTTNYSSLMTILGNGNVGIGTTTPLVTFDVRGNSGTLAVASVSGRTSFAALVANNDGVGDLFTASSSGLPLFTITKAGNVIPGTNGGQDLGSTTRAWRNVYGTTYFSGASTGVTASLGCVSSTLGIVTGSGACPGGGGGTSPFTELGGVIYPNNITSDFLIGGQSTTSAKFALIGINGARGIQIASLSGSLTLDSSTASIQTTKNQLLTLGGNTTGSIQFKPGNSSTSLYLSSIGNVGIGTTNPLGALHVATANEAVGTNRLIAQFQHQTTNDGGSAIIRLGKDTFSFTDFEQNGCGNNPFRYGSTYCDTNIINGDLDSGPYGNINFVTNGSIRMTIGGGSYAGRLGLGVIFPLATLDVRGATGAGTLAVASFSAKTSFAALVANNDGVGDLFTASSSGVGKFTVKRTGDVNIAGGLGLGGTAVNTGNAIEAPSFLIQTNGYIYASGLRNFNTSNNANIELPSTGTFISRNVADSNPALYIEQSHASSTGDILQLKNSSSIQFRVLQNGRVGIGGPSSPLATLDIRGVAGAGTISIASVSGKTSFAALVANNDGVGDLFTASQSGWTRFVIKGNGNVGIGTNDPQAKLDIAGSSSTISNTSGDITITPTGNLIISAGNVGIGDTTPSFKLDVADTQATTYVAQINNLNTSNTADGLIINLGVANASRGTGNYFIGFAGAGTVAGKIQGGASAVAYTTTAADYAEYFRIADINNKPEPGDLISLSTIDKSVEKSLAPSHAIGVFSTNPGFIGNGPLCDQNDNDCDNNYAKYNVLVGLSGQITTKVSAINGPIKPGDPLTASTIAGVAVKATSAGFIIGHALEAYSQQETGKIKALISPSWYDPDVYLTSTGDLNIASSLNTQNGQTTYSLRNTGNNLIQRAGAFSDAAIATLKAGFIGAQQISTNTLSVATENITINGQNIRDYIAGIVADIINSTNNNLISPIASIDTLNTNLISPIGNDSKIALKLSDTKLEILNTKYSTGSAVASIDNQGNASFSGSLAVGNDATISGTLRAGRILASDIVGLNIQAATISANYITNVTNVYSSTPAAFPTLGVGSLVSSTGSGFFGNLFANNSFLNISNFSSELAYIENLNAANASFSQGLMVYGPTSLSDTSIVGQLSVNGSLILADNSINVLGSDLNLQPLRQGGLSIMAGLFYIDTNGNATFGADVTVKGTLYANAISSIPGNDLTLETGNSKLEVRNASNSATLSLDSLGNLVASGAATFAKLNLGSLVSPVLAVSSTEIVATGSAGNAFINAYKTEMTINNKLVTDKSLIYITPTSNTNNQVLFLLKQVPGRSFTVGLPNPSNIPIPFNWIIVN